MNQYEHALVAMKRLLEGVGESHWAEWIAVDLRKWREARDTSHHLSAYGGMGSFNDVWISRLNQHTVGEAQEAWATELFEWLKALCHFLAQRPEKSFNAAQLRAALGKSDPTLSAFVGGENAPDAMRRLSGGDLTLQGWRCLRCGHSETAERSLEALIAQDVIPALVFEAAERAALDRVVDAALAAELGDRDLRRSLAAAAAAAGVVVRERSEWMDRCRECGKDDTALYRWRLVGEDPPRLEPADDNLRLRWTSFFRRLFRRKPLV